MLVGFASLFLAACSNPAPKSSSGTTMPSSATVPPSGNAQSEAQNLVVSPGVRAELLAVGARFHGAPLSQYAGLAPGLTYYAYDTSTATYWAGAKLVPKVPSSGPPTQAEVSSQDEGAYTVFTRKAHTTTWRAYDTGETGAADVRCPVVVPAAVLRAWGWPTGSCRAPGA